MGRRRKPPESELATRLDEAMQNLGLTPQEVAAAARVHKGTLYRILSGRTKDPHHSTLRRLCKVLQIEFLELVGSEQLELWGEKLEKSGLLRDLEELLKEELRLHPPEELGRVGAIAGLAILEVSLAMGKTASHTNPGHIRLLSSSRSFARTQELLIDQLRQVPEIARPAALRNALGFLIDLRMVMGAQPSRLLYARIHHLRHRLWEGLEHSKRMPRTAQS